MAYLDLGNESVLDADGAISELIGAPSFPPKILKHRLLEWYY